MNKSTFAGVVVAIVIALAALGIALSSGHAPVPGGVTNYDEVDATAIKIGGASGSRIGPVISTTCNLLNTNASQAATTSAYVYCNVTGVVSGDTILAQLSTTTANTRFGHWSIVSAKASTTATGVDMELYNGSGASAVPSATAIGSSTNLLITHPRSSVPGL